MKIKLEEVIRRLDIKLLELNHSIDENQARLTISSMKPYLKLLYESGRNNKVGYYINEIAKYNLNLEEK